MLIHNTHDNERREHAKRLSLSLEEFDELVHSANHAYEVIKDLGPFYGKEEIKDPTFRITAHPVKLPEGSKELLTDLGNDLIHVAKALQKLPDEQKAKLGRNIDFRIPPTWRIDAIINEHGRLQVNEVEGVDSANALMMAEQLAYNLQTLQDSSAAVLIPTFVAMCREKKKQYKIAFIRNLIPYSPHTVNHERFIQFLHILSNGMLKVDLLDESNIRNGITLLDWKEYDGIINHTSLTPDEIHSMGIRREQLFAAGNYNALVNKGFFPLLFDDKLDDFWIKNIGTIRFERLRTLLIPSHFITSVSDLDKARSEGKVVKASWADKNVELINRSRGVAMPIDSIEQGKVDRWDKLRQLQELGTILISQDFVMPAKIPSLLRKKGYTLEYVEWYNRVCVKYVSTDNPNIDEIPAVKLTATEVTLGPDVIPAGRSCAFTAGQLC